MDDFFSDIEKCLEVLRQGGIILYPTDTVWGLGCDATDANAVEKIYRLKRRPVNKAMVVLVAEQKDILRYVSQTHLQVFDYLQTLSKPTTIIYQGIIGVADNLVGDNGTMGIRIIQEPFCKHLIKRFRKPVVSTSANLSGEPTPRFFKEISEDVIKGADYVVNYRQHEDLIAEPSSIIKWNKDGTVTVIRP